MYQEKLSAKDWKSAVIEFIKIINRQYCTISLNPISSDWDDSCGSPRVTLEFANRSLKLAFEALWFEAMQGHCYVKGEYTLELVYA